MTDIITSELDLPAHWASALVNEDFTGLEEAEADRCAAEARRLADQGWTIADMVEESERFSWGYNLYDDCGSGITGGTVATFIIMRQAR